MDNNEKQLSESVDATYRGYAWDYFSLHADQRMKSFHFYIILVTAIMGGLAAIIKDGHFNKFYSIFGAILSIFSFLFWKLDERTRQLVKIAEDALIYLDKKYVFQDESLSPHPLRIFSRDNESILNANRRGLILGHFSYARVFRWIFGLFGTLGVCIIIFFLMTASQ